MNWSCVIAFAAVGVLCILYWEPYGQLWEEVSHVGWRAVAIVVALLAFFIHALVILGRRS